MSCDAACRGKWSHLIRGAPLGVEQGCRASRVTSELNSKHFPPNVRDKDRRTLVNTVLVTPLFYALVSLTNISRRRSRNGLQPAHGQRDSLWSLRGHYPSRS